MRRENSISTSPIPANLRHLPALARVLWAFTQKTDWRPNVIVRFTDLMTLAKVTRRGWVHVLMGPKGVQAFIIRDKATIHALYVSPEMRGFGGGKVLMLDAKNRHPWLQLWADQLNERAIGFYRAQGFFEVGRSDGHDNDENRPDIHFNWLKDQNTCRELI